MPSVRTTRARWITAACSLLLAAPLLVSCASPPDPAVAREALAEVTEEPTPPEVNEEYSATLHPEPIVEALECSPYLVITARGTGEPKKKQLLAPVVRAIKKALPDEVTHLDLDYPADTDVQEGGALGARTLVDTLNVQSLACPEQGIVLLGYSQGALIIGDSLTAPEFRLVGGNVGEVTEFATTRIQAIVLYGNPRFVGEEVYNFGSYSETSDRLLPRPPGSFDLYTLRLRDFCVEGDFICQRSLNLDEDGHIAYYDNGMQQDGATFALSRLRLHEGIGETGSVGDPSAPLEAPLTSEPGEPAQESPAP